jgi:hypothetical protein
MVKVVSDSHKAMTAIILLSLVLALLQLTQCLLLKCSCAVFSAILLICCPLFSFCHISWQVGGFGSQVREVRPLIADAAVHTMGEQAIPRESLTWHLGFVYRGEEKRYLEALKEAHVLPTTDDDILTWEASLLGLQSSAMSENAQHAAGNVKSRTTLEVSSPVTSQQVAQVTFTSVTPSVVFGQNVTEGAPNKLVLWRRIVPIVVLAVVIGVVS